VLIIFIVSIVEGNFRVINADTGEDIPVCPPNKTEKVWYKYVNCCPLCSKQDIGFLEENEKI
jgi:hypothetical protein